MKKLVCRALQFQLIAYDRYKAVGYDRDTHLDSDGVLRHPPEFLDLKMLLEPFEEQFDLPSVPIVRIRICLCSFVALVQDYKDTRFKSSRFKKVG